MKQKESECEKDCKKSPIAGAMVDTRSANAIPTTFPIVAQELAKEGKENSPQQGADNIEFQAKPVRNGHQIIEEILGPVVWKSNVRGIIQCPGHSLHDKASIGTRDCEIALREFNLIDCPFSGQTGNSCRTMIYQRIAELKAELEKYVVEWPAGCRPGLSAFTLSPEERSKLIELTDNAWPTIRRDGYWTEEELCHKSPADIRGSFLLHAPKLLCLWEDNDLLDVDQNFADGLPQKEVKVKVKCLKEIAFEACGESSEQHLPRFFSESAMGRNDYPWNWRESRRRFLVLKMDRSAAQPEGCNQPKCTNSLIVCKWLKESLNLHLRAVIDGNAKGMHCLFELPPNRVLTELEVLLPHLGIELSSMLPSHPIPFPGFNDGVDSCKLLYLDLKNRPYTEQKADEHVEKLPSDVLKNYKKTAGLPKAISLGAIKKLPEQNSTDLIKHGFLRRNGSLLIAAPAGIGKSTLLMQMAIFFAIGRPVLGMIPNGRLRCLLIDGENDLPDLADIKFGILNGMDLTEEEKALIDDAVMVRCESDLVGRDLFDELIEPIMNDGQFDWIGIDPALSFLGGDANSANDVGGFLRNGLSPVLKKFNCGGVLVHHTNKPKIESKHVKMSAGYSAGGSAEWTNWPRSILSLKGTKGGNFELRGDKNAKDLRWRDQTGNPTSVRLVQHCKRPGVELWEDCTEQFDSGTSRNGRSKWDPEAAGEQVLKLISPSGSMRKSELQALAHGVGISRERFQKIVAKLEESGKLRRDKVDRSRTNAAVAYTRL